MFRNGIYSLGTGTFNTVKLAPKWFGSGSGEGDDDPGKIVEKKFESLETTVKEIQNKSVSKEEFNAVAEGVAAINKRFAEEDERRKEAAKRQQQQQQQQQQTDYDPEKEFEVFAADPRKYFQSLQQPANNATLLALGKQKVAELLSGKPYYHGEFKTKVDALIFSTQDFAQLNNPEYIINAYRIIYAQYAEEDKLKDMKRAASLEMGEGTGTEGVNKDKDTVTVSFRSNNQYSEGKARAAAAALGITDEDLTKTAEEGTIKGLEVIA